MRKQIKKLLTKVFRMKKVEQRQAEILEILNQSGKVEVTKLAAKCGVSLVTMRKDLSELEARGLLKREQGTAFLVEENDMRRRLAVNYAVKCKLARRAADLVADGETVMIESGSCCILLAEELCRSKKHVTVITNSIFMAEYIGKDKNISLVLLGGDYQADSQAVVGPVARMGAAMFHVHRLFAGTDGYLQGSGFTGDNHLRAELIRSMAENAEQVVMLTESFKFSKQGIVPLFQPQEVDYLVTDSFMPENAEKELELQGVRIMKVRT